MSYKHRCSALIRLATQRSTLPARLQASETPAKIELLHEAALLVLRRQRSRPFIIILKHYSAPHVKENRSYFSHTDLNDSCRKGIHFPIIDAENEVVSMLFRRFSKVQQVASRLTLHRTQDKICRSSFGSKGCEKSRIKYDTGRNAGSNIGCE